MHDSEVIALQAFQAGARAFLLKADANKMLLTAVESLIIHKPFYEGSFTGELKGMTTGKVRTRCFRLEKRRSSNWLQKGTVTRA